MPWSQGSQFCCAGHRPTCPFLPGHPFPTFWCLVSFPNFSFGFMAQFAKSLDSLFLSSYVPSSLLSTLLCPGAVMENGFYLNLPSLITASAVPCCEKILRHGGKRTVWWISNICHGHRRGKWLCIAIHLPSLGLHTDQASGQTRMPQVFLYIPEQGLESMTPRPNWVHHLFLYGPRVKNIFYIFKWLEKTKTGWFRNMASIWNSSFNSNTNFRVHE